MALKRFLKAVEKLEEQVKKPEAPKTPEAGDESNWLVSYADMMTLLCVFFILLFSMAKLDDPKYESVKAEVAKQFGGDYKAPTQELARFISQVIQDAKLENNASIKTDAGGVTITFQSTVFFDTLSSEVKPLGKDILSKLIASVTERQEKEEKKYKVVIEGHTDSRPVIGGPYPSNWELSGARAATVVRMFLEHGFAPDRLTAIGYADTRPQIPGRTPAGNWDDEALGKNRRVVIRILEPTVDSIPYAEAAEPVTGAEATAAAAPVSPPVPQQN